MIEHKALSITRFIACVAGVSFALLLEKGGPHWRLFTLTGIAVAIGVSVGWLTEDRNKLQPDKR
jgi:hypothetical protein